MGGPGGAGVGVVPAVDAGSRPVSDDSDDVVVLVVSADVGPW